MEKFNTNEFYKQIKFPFYVGTDGSFDGTPYIEDIIDLSFDLDSPVKLLLSNKDEEETFEVGLSGKIIDNPQFTKELVLKASFPERSITYRQLINILESEGMRHSFMVFLESDEEDNKIQGFVFDSYANKIQLGNKSYLLSQSVVNI